MPGAEPRRQLLYVEDEPDSFKLAALRLRPNFALLWAQTDKEACDILVKAGANLHAVLMDIELKGSELDGLKLTRVLRGKSMPKQVPDYAKVVRPLALPVIVLTAYTARFTEADAKDAGANHLVTKPIDFNRLTQLLVQTVK